MANGQNPWASKNRFKKELQRQVRQVVTQWSKPVVQQRRLIKLFGDFAPFFRGFSAASSSHFSSKAKRWPSKCPWAGLGRLHAGCDACALEISDDFDDLYDISMCTGVIIFLYGSMQYLILNTIF